MSSQDMSSQKIPSRNIHFQNLASQNLKVNAQSPEAWFVNFFIGSMISISFLTVGLSFLPSSSGIRNPNNLKPTTQISITQAIG